MDPVLDALWQRVLEDWEDDARHGKLLGYAQEQALLGVVAGLYKSVDTSDSPYRLDAEQLDDARKRLAGVVLLATMSMKEADPVPQMKGLKRTLQVVSVLMFLLVLVVGYKLLARR